MPNVIHAEVAPGVRKESGPKGALTAAGGIIRDTVVATIEDGVPQRGAALAYYVLLSLGPFLVILVGLLEFFFSSDETRAGVIRAVGTYAGPRAAETAATVLSSAQVPSLLAPEAIVSAGVLFFGATAVFANVRDALDKIWHVGGREQSNTEIALNFVRGRLRGFLMIVVTGIVLLFSVVLSSAANVVVEEFQPLLPFGGAFLVRVTDFLVSLVVVGLVFAAIFRTLPSVRISWRNVWVGGFTTALLFALGKSVVAWLIASASWTSYYGQGASVVAFIAWIYFSAQLFFIGAEFTQVWSDRHGGLLAGESS